MVGPTKTNFAVLVAHWRYKKDSFGPNLDCLVNVKKDINESFAGLRQILHLNAFRHTAES